MYQRVKDVDHPKEDLLSVYRDHGVVKRDDRNDNFNKAALDRSIYQLVHPGWLVVNRMKAWQGSVGVSPFRGIVSGHYLSFRPAHQENDCFLNWLFRSRPYTAEYASLSRGVRPGQVEIDNERLRALRVMLPPLEEQHRIANFLNAEVARIDRLIAKKRLLIDLLNERIDSRVLGHVGASTLARAEGTPTMPIRRILSRVARPPRQGQDTITAYRNGQVTVRSSRRAEGYTLSASTEPQGQLVRIGDVVVHGLDGFAGAIGTSEAQGNCSPVYHVCTPRNGEDPRFLGRLLRLLALQGYLGSFAISTRERAVDLRNWDLFGRIPIPVIPLSEQHEISRWISEVTPLRETIERSTTLATERRQALITAAVTGQFDVSTASGRNVTEGVSV
ncbi:type I restriction enzyme S subunit [Streptomyces sp. 3330]|uniref:restriction endonuclease subunit S n=1 Tax=Streptomyces sp. 3330 TaxID=2817755 RepID=UPI002857DEA8|nr:restriction endonuclease subunit S [Streptomyces sp. 3330]MDR6976239.1 type I restriction enzyme S subunit [Streptomyces sp. 3330]